MAISAKLKNKVSPHIQKQLPEFIQAEHPLFSTFLKHYYEFLEAGELTLSGSNNYLVQETNTLNYIFDEDEEKVVLEDSVGKFINGETIVGQTTKVTAKILVEDFDDNKRLFITAQQLFNNGEEVVGQTSGATSIVSSYRANPVQNIQQLLSYADIDNTVYSFLDKFRDSFMEAVPETLASGISKRNLLKNIRDLYSAKGTEDGHKLFFRILFNETPELIYPKDNMLRSSDGQWTRDKVMHVLEQGNSDFSQAIGEVVTGLDSGATAIIQSLTKFREATVLVTELLLDENSISGEFIIGETVETISTTLDLPISATTTGVVTEGTITNGGLYHQTGDTINIGAGGSETVRLRVEMAGTGSVNEVFIDDAGTNYSLDDVIVFNNANTNGSDASARIVSLGGALSLEQVTSPDFIIYEDGDYVTAQHGFGVSLEAEDGTIISEDATDIIQEQGDKVFLRQETSIGETENLVQEDGSLLILEDETFTDLGVSSEAGSIRKVEVIRVGGGYYKLPTLSITSSTGSGATVYAKSTTGIGHAEGVSITNFGLNYTTPPTLTFNRNILVKNLTGGNFASGDQLTSHDGIVVDFDNTRNLLEIKTAVSFLQGDIITTAAGTTATVEQSDHATATSSVGVVGTGTGRFVTDRGAVSTTTMRIQDSLYYQDYSYVVRVGESINFWRDSLKRTIHPSGWQVFGEVSLATTLAEAQSLVQSARIKTPAAGAVPSYTGDDTFTPELASTFTNLFTTIFGRRTGAGSIKVGTNGLVTRTLEQGTLNSNPKDGVDLSSQLNDGQRELVAASVVKVNLGVIGKESLWSGHTSLANLPVYAFAVEPIYTEEIASNYHDPAERRITRNNDQSRDLYNIDQFGSYTIKSVSDYYFLRLENALDYNGDKITLEDGSGSLQGEELHIPNNAFTTRINVPPPSQILISRGGLINTFDNDFLTFDDGIQLFDESTSDGSALDTEGRYAESFDDGSINLDSTTITFDAASGNEVDFEATFDTTVTRLDGAVTMDAGEHTFDQATPGTTTNELFSGLDITFDSNEDNLRFDDSELSTTRYGWAMLDFTFDRTQTIGEDITFDKTTE